MFRYYFVIKKTIGGTQKRKLILKCILSRRHSFRVFSLFLLVKLRLFPGKKCTHNISRCCLYWHNWLNSNCSIKPRSKRWNYNLILDICKLFNLANYLWISFRNIWYTFPQKFIKNLSEIFNFFIVMGFEIKTIFHVAKWYVLNFRNVFAESSHTI